MSDKKIDCFDFGEYRLDVANCQLFKSGEPVSLTQKSFDILKFLIENRGRIIKKEEFLDSMWEGSFVEEANLTQHIYMLRKALKQKRGSELYIETIPKNGYRFVADVREVTPTTALAAQAHRNSNGLARLNGNSDISDEFEDEILFAENLSVPGNSAERNELALNERVRSEPRPKSYRLLTFSSAVLAVILFAGGFLYFATNLRASGTGDIRNKSIAVLPFKQVSNQKDAKLGVGIADVLIARLANFEDIDVRPTTSIMRFDGEENSDLFEVGQKLGVDCVIEGTIQREGDKVRITAQLFDVKLRRQVWTEKFDEEYSDIFTLQDKISERVTRKLSAEMPADRAVSSYKQYTKNAKAYRAYSMGLSYWNMHSRDGFVNAVSQFNKALEEDPKFAMAYAYLADTYAHTSYLSELMTQDEARKKGEKAAKKALEIDEQNAEAMAALALIYANTDRQKQAFELMKRSVAIKPNDAHARHRISWMYANKGNIDQAIDEMRIAQKLDPQSAYINLFLAEMLLLSREPDGAIQFLEKALEIEPASSSARWRMIEAYEQKGDFKKALGLLKELTDRSGTNPGTLLVKSRLLAQQDQTKEARELLDKVVSKGLDAQFYGLTAYAEIALGDKEKAVRRLTKMIEATNDNIYVIKYDSKLDEIRDDPGFAQVLENKEAAQGW